MKIIKKYKNRRLYDKELSQYITFEQLRKYIEDDIEFKIVDSSSEKDITNATLLQIIVEQEANKNPFLSKQMLLNIIKFSNHPMHEMMSEFLESSFKMLHENTNQSAFVEQYQKMSTQWMEQMQHGFKAWQDIMMPDNKKNR